MAADDQDPWGSLEVSWQKSHCKVKDPSTSNRRQWIGDRLSRFSHLKKGVDLTHPLQCNPGGWVGGPTLPPASWRDPDYRIKPFALIGLRAESFRPKSLIEHFFEVDHIVQIEVAPSIPIFEMAYLSLVCPASKGIRVTTQDLRRLFDGDNSVFHLDQTSYLKSF